MSHNCVVKGTQITLENNETKSIESLKAGDTLLSYSIIGIENTQKYNILKELFTDTFDGDFSYQLVKNLWKNSVESYYNVNDELFITEDHYVFVKSNNIYYWKEVKDLELNDYLFKSDNSFELVETIKLVKNKVDVYNLAVNSIYTYFANGYLVHNGLPCNNKGLCGACGGSSDIRLKENIIFIEFSDSGIPIYSWNYKSGYNLDSINRYIGTMAQDLLELGLEDAVITEPDGYYSVNYSILPDVTFRQI